MSYLVEVSSNQDSTAKESENRESLFRVASAAVNITLRSERVYPRRMLYDGGILAPNKIASTLFLKLLEICKVSGQIYSSLDRERISSSDWMGVLKYNNLLVEHVDNNDIQYALVSAATRLGYKLIQFDASSIAQFPANASHTPLETIDLENINTISKFFDTFSIESPMDSLAQYPVLIYISGVDEYIKAIMGGEDGMSNVLEFSKHLQLFLQTKIELAIPLLREGKLADGTFVIVLSTKSISKLSLVVKNQFSFELSLNSSDDVDDHIRNVANSFASRNSFEPKGVFDVMESAVTKICGNKCSFSIAKAVISELLLGSLKDKDSFWEDNISTANIDSFFHFNIASFVETWKVKTDEDATKFQAQKNIIQVKWEDIGGLEKVRKEIMDIFELPRMFPEYFPNSRSRKRGILLFGPPGSGKVSLCDFLFRIVLFISFLS